MLRRKFIDQITAWLSGLMFWPALLKSSPPKSQAYYSKTISIKTNGRVRKIRYLKISGQVYISLVDFSNESEFGIFTNSTKRKTVVYIGRDKAKFTDENGFVVLNEQIYQFIYEPKWRDGEIWVPANMLAELFDRNTSHKMRFDDTKMEFVIGQKDVNISNVKISAMENGTLIHIFTRKEFSKGDITLKIANGWLHVDIFKGTVDEQSLSRKQSIGLISEVRAVQFEQLVSIAFRLRKGLKSKDLKIDPESNDILLSLRTEEALEQDKDATEELEQQKKDWMINTIVIDPGHGGKDPGAIGYGKLKEKDIVLPVSLKLGAALKKRIPGIKIVYTRDRDIFIPLWKRTKIANESEGKLFISLHCNAIGRGNASGFETYFLSAEKDAKARDVVLKENESIGFESMDDKKRYEGINFVLATLAQNAFIKYSQYLATVVQKSLGKNLRSVNMKDRGVKQGPFWVMVGAAMPNILIEMGFISNKYEAKLLKQKSTQTKIANAICDGIVKYKNDIESAR